MGQADSQALSGRVSAALPHSRLDYKVWAESPPRLDLSTGEQIDVCYCNDGCSGTGSAANWFRIGHVIGGRFNLAAKAGASSPQSTYRIAQIAGKPGILAFQGGGKTPFELPAGRANKFVQYNDGPKFSDKAMIKVISYNKLKLIKQTDGEKVAEWQLFWSLISVWSTKCHARLFHTLECILQRICACRPTETVLTTPVIIPFSGFFLCPGATQ